MDLADNRAVETPAEKYVLDVETLRRIELNDPDIDSLLIGEIFGSNWIEGTGRAIGESHVLRTLKIHNVADDSDESWLEEFCDGLSRNRSIEKLVLRIEDDYDKKPDIFHIIAPFFEHNMNLRSVDVYYFAHSRYSGSVMTAMTACTFTNHHLHHFRFTYEDGNEDEDEDESIIETGVASLIESLIKQDDLLELALGNKFGRMGIIALATILTHSQSKIQVLELRRHELGNEGATILGTALTNNNTLKKLILREDSTIELVGWRGFSDCLRSPHSALEELQIFNCLLNFESIREISTALVHNRHLKVLDLLRGYHVSLLMAAILRQKIWHCLCNVVCDETSIEGTYFSNHTLCCVRVAGSTYTSSYLTMNENENKASVARQKILMHHFTRSVEDIHVFAQMSEKVMPHAINWIGRDSLGYSLMLNFVRGNPTLFDISSSVPHLHAGVKRKQC